MKSYVLALVDEVRFKTHWTSKAHRVLFWLCATLLALYLSFITYLANSSFLMGVAQTTSSLFWFLLYALLWLIILLWGCVRLRGGNRLLTQKRKWPPALWTGSVGFSLFILGARLMEYYPGGISYDVYNQWMQMESLQLNSWHPVFHTLLMWLGTRLFHNYTWLVFFQILIFAAVFACLICTLYCWGVPKNILFFLQWGIVASNVVGNSMMYVWKDNALTIGVVGICSMCLNVYCTQGGWLEKSWHAVLLGIMLAFTTLVRHNAILYTIPLAMILFVCYCMQRKQMLLTVGVMILCVGMVAGPLYTSLNIVKPNNTLEETVGVPMTILFDIRHKNPDALEPETAAFLEDLVPHDVMNMQYEPGNYNSIKFTYPREYISTVDPVRLLSMTQRAAARAPRQAFEAVVTLTDLVWDISGKNEGVETVRNSGDLQEYPSQASRINRMGAAMNSFLTAPFSLLPIQWMTQNIGVQFVSLMMCTLWALYRHGSRALMLGVPMLVYNLGTMLLLCGNDARFFQYSMVITFPAMLILFRRQATLDV